LVEAAGCVVLVRAAHPMGLLMIYREKVFSRNAN
jgi:hypothetical protein